jgi:hypothetical protein
MARPNRTLTHLKFSASEKKQHIQFHKAVANPGAEIEIDTKRLKHRPTVKITGMQFLKKAQEQVS